MSRGAASSRRRSLGLAFVVLFLVATPATAATTDTAAAPEPAFVVDLQSDGDARITLRLRFDLTSDAELQAFRSLRNDANARRNLRAQFLERMRSVAANVEAPERRMRVRNATVDFRTHAGGEVGVVRVSVTWTELAARSEGRLVVSEPFAGEFAPDRRFVVRAPAGYTIADVTPRPEERTAASAAWSAESSLDGFRLIAARTTTSTVSPTPTPSTARDGTNRRTTQGRGPGFGLALAVTALVTAAAVTVRRRD